MTVAPSVLEKRSTSRPKMADRFPEPAGPVRDMDGHIVRLVVTSPHEWTCRRCGETWHEPYCGRCDDFGHKNDAILSTVAHHFVRTVDYLKPGEYRE